MIALTENKTKLFVVLFAATLLLAIAISRLVAGNPVLVGDEPYYNLRVASTIIEKGFVPEDRLVYGGIPFLYTPYNLLLGGIGIIAGLKITTMLLPFLVGFLTLACLYKILGQLGFEPGPKLIFCGLYIISPVFLYTVFSGNNAGAALFLQLTGFLFYLKLGRITFASTVFLSVASLFGPAHMLVSLMLIGGYAFYDKKKLPHLCLLIFIFVLIALFVYLPQTHKEGLPLIEFSVPYFAHFVADFGATKGFSIFLLALAMVGFLRVWSKTKESYLLFSLLLVGATFFFGINSVYSNVILVFIATLGFIYILKSPWTILALKRIAILLIVMGLIGSTGSYASGLIHGLPDMEIINAMEWLKQNSLSEDTIYSAAENGVWIETFAERTVLLDTLLKKTEWLKEREAAADALLRLYNIKKTIALLKRYNINYIVVAADMGKTKNNEEDGLYNLLNNNETFKKIYHKADIRIYAINRQVFDCQDCV